MSFDPANWSRLHGATTHFPIALMLVSALCDFLSLLPLDFERQRGLTFTATVTIVLGALGSLAAAVSGLIMTKGEMWGHGTLLRHHQFVWPALALMIGLAVWRIWKRNATARATALYLGVMALTALLVSIAGYWGGEVLNQG